MRVVSRPRPGHDYDPENHEVYWDSRFHAATGGQSEFAWDNLVLLAEIAYTLRVNARIGIRTSYDLGYYSADQPLRVQMSMHSFRGSILWLF